MTEPIDCPGESSGNLVDDWWSDPNREPDGVQWGECAAVARNIQVRCSGKPGIDWISDCEQFMGHLARPRSALSLGCGFGQVDRIFRQRDIVQHILGIDVAQGAIAGAGKAARDAGLQGLEYRVVDLDVQDLPESEFDVVICHAALHHVFQIERVLGQVSRCLRPGGIFVLNEYVGPSQMQWPKPHVELAEALLKMIPRAHRKQIRFEGYKDAVMRLPLSTMNSSDPSESIRSHEIVPLVAARFIIVKARGFGGTLLMQLLNEIAGNFPDGDPETSPLIEGFIHLENTLIDMGALPSYHAYIVARKPEHEALAQSQDYLPPIHPGYH